MRHQSQRIEDFFGLKCMHCGLTFTREVWETCVDNSSDRDDKRPLPDRYGTTLYDTTTGSPEVGDVYFAPWYGEVEGKPVFVVHLPKGWVWPSNQHASNCPHTNAPKDKWHQCWTVEGQIPNITVRPSIMMGEGVGQIHGFITNGKWRDC